LLFSSLALATSGHGRHQAQALGGTCRAWNKKAGANGPYRINKMLNLQFFGFYIYTA
jgi:hypothetical protein